MSRDWTEHIYGDMESTNIDDIIKEKEKQIERLQKQLNEANEVIKWYDMLENILICWEMATGQPAGTAKKYLDKWGVK